MEQAHKRPHRLRRLRPYGRGAPPEGIGVEFRTLAEGTRFTLYPHNFVNIDFIKVAPYSAEIYTWDEHAPRQRFAHEAIVYPYPERRSEKKS